jgi:hypothetical protein
VRHILEHQTGEMAIKRRLREIITLSDYYYYYYYYYSSPFFEKVPHLVAVVVLVAERKGIYPGRSFTAFA